VRATINRSSPSYVFPEDRTLDGVNQIDYLTGRSEKSTIATGQK
jgi:hypothetical protein